jgi:hypothetical protein
MKTFMILSAAFLLTQATHAYASTASYTCTSQNETINVEVNSGTLKIEGGDEINGSKGTLDSSYKPRAEHVGSTRYNLDVDCEGNVAVILDKAMTSGKNGNLTVQANCDSDGTGPTFEVYSCEK